MAETAEIPEPRGLPLLGHAANVDSEFPLGTMMSYASQFGKCMFETISDLPSYLRFLPT